MESGKNAATKNKLTVTLPSDREVLLSRYFDAPREMVFEAITKPEHVVRWWGPGDVHMAVCEIDFRVGGAWHFVLVGSGGHESEFRGVYREIVRPDRVVATEVYMNPAFGNPEVLSTMTLTECDGGTQLTRLMLHASKENRDGYLNAGMENAAGEAYDQLAELVENADAPEAMEREIEITRVFDASPGLVYEAWTKPEHMTHWWGPRVFTNHSCELDVRPGGAWRIVMQAPDGTDYPCQGVYSEVISGERLAFTNDAVDQTGKPLLKGFTTVTFAPVGSKTLLTVKTRASGLVDYAPRLLQGMAAGWNQSLDGLASYCASGSLRTP